MTDKHEHDDEPSAEESAAATPDEVGPESATPAVESAASTPPPAPGDDEPDEEVSSRSPDATDLEDGGAAAADPDPLDLSVPVAELDVEDAQDPSTASAAQPDAAAVQEVGPVDHGAERSAGPPEPAEPRDDEDDLPPPEGAREEAAPTGWRALVGTVRPRANRSQLLALVLCAALGFALVVQVQQSAQDPLTSARQDDLVRLLDEVTQRSEQLQDEVVELSQTRDELRSGTGQAQAAVELAQERASSEGILSGRLPATGPGLEIVVQDPQGLLPASKMFNVLEELRNAGAEVVELNGLRLVTSTWFLDSDDGIVVDGVGMAPPYRWTVIGDPATLSPALEIPGGALATVRTEGAEASTTEHDVVEVTAVREPSEPQYATPRSPEE